MYIYIYIHRERERDVSLFSLIYVSILLNKANVVFLYSEWSTKVPLRRRALCQRLFLGGKYIYKYIYIYIERERDRPYGALEIFHTGGSVVGVGVGTLALSFRLISSFDQVVHRKQIPIH